MTVIREDDYEKVKCSELGMHKTDVIDDLINNCIEFCDGGELLLVVGKEDDNVIAVDNNGNVVLIKINCGIDLENHVDDVVLRTIAQITKYSEIKNVNKFVNHIFELNESNSIKIEFGKLNKFLKKNNVKNFNETQRVILVAEEYGKETLNAINWLNERGIDIRCFKLKIRRYVYTGQFITVVEKIIPNTNPYIEIINQNVYRFQDRINRLQGQLPRIMDMISVGVVTAGDVLKAKDYESEAELLENGNVLVDGEEKSIRAWLKSIYPMSNPNAYNLTIHKKTGKTLAEIREEYMEKLP
ncbi:hypothetical protein HNP86_000965 [Methanococcus maripaludis]|uniref:Uncharacterized protein n=1 Tax=Methanococcus maripaludis TaxID=39152 RepID=A0A7J9NU51_METMI|nr:hypothetical protein [Methanococcus maripaludis]MBA2850834.1 hypothetical protein [Methanococcus maripaludis]